VFGGTKHVTKSQSSYRKSEIRQQVTPLRGAMCVCVNLHILTDTLSQQSHSTGVKQQFSPLSWNTHSCCCNYCCL